MCGRYTLRVSPAELAEIFETLRTIEWSARYNIAPTPPRIQLRLERISSQRSEKRMPDQNSARKPARRIAIPIAIACILLGVALSFYEIFYDDSNLTVPEICIFVGVTLLVGVKTRSSQSG